MASRKFKEDWTPTPLRPAPGVSVGPPLSMPPLDRVPPSQPGSALGAAAGSALAAAKASAAGTALAAASAVAAARATEAGAALASALEPIPSPVALINRAGYIVRFLIVWTLREIFRVAFSALVRPRPRTIESARQAREFAERLGGMWIIMARLAALRHDLLGIEFCRELARTRDLSVPLPIGVVRKTVEDELRTVNRTFEEVFSEFDDEPLTVRSFGQMHRARLRQSGREVTVRVRAPDALQRAATDWRYIRMVHWFMDQLDLEPHLRVGDLLYEVKKSTDDLLDFRSEVTELRRIRGVLRRRRIYVPTVFRRYCTEKMLVLEYIKGVNVADLQQVAKYDPERLGSWMRENKIDPRRVWRRLFNAHHELLFEHNLFYTELIPSSIMLLRDNRIALVSLGTIGTLDADLQTKYRRLYRSFIQGDFTKACDTYLMMGPALPYKDTTNMKQSVIRALRKWESRTHVKLAPYSEKSLGSAVAQLARCATEQRLPAFWNLARLQSAERLLNMTLEFFDPTKSSLKALKRYERSAQIRAIKQATTKRVRKRINSAVDVAELNMQLLENFEHDGDYLRRRLHGVQAKLSKVSEIGGRLILMMAKLAMVALVVQVFLYIKHGYHVSLPVAEQGTLGRLFNALRPQSKTAWIVLLVVLFFSRRFLVNLARQFLSKEVRPGDVL